MSMFAAIASHYVAASAYTDALALATPTSGQLAWYRCWDAGTTAADASSATRNGTWANVTTGQTSLLADGAGTSVLLNGTSSYGEVPDDGAFDGLSAFSVFAVIKTSAAALQMIVSRDKSSTSERSFHFRTTAAGKLEFVKIAGGTVSVASTASVNTNTAVPVGVTYDGANIRLYVNGAQDGAAAATGTLGTIALPLLIGHYMNSLNQRLSVFSGNLQELMLYSRALTATEMSDLAAAAT